ncbi:hypothetical protein [Falsiroseomonas tokyonensis]|uniref:Integrase n=1 Tax=Falsiroseomonas tokyonensis TaxID=430521 RepID=A0ABV7C337_9PROT|nr:hypothetical protein [Falsiroseomonas tokyonensis]MBU8541846.1 hypothetical protein [Falsiroseomonas tokyonensis]
MTLHDDVLRFMQKRVANACVGASALRGSTEGTLEAVRAFFRDLNLQAFSGLSSSEFEQRHAATVAGLRRSLSKKGLSAEYGRCAKAVNLFLRDAACHHHLRGAFHLDRIEPLLHIPVDEKVAYELRRLSAARSLPRWTGVKALTAEDYRKFQHRAAELATERQTCRVFLDDEFWSRPKSERPQTRALKDRRQAARRVSP